MPTTITIPVADRTKSIQYGATYSSALSFNPDKALLVGCSAVLAGMGVTVNTGPVPAEATVAIGAFIQNGIIVSLNAPQTLQFPAAPIAIPLYLVAENDNETFNSNVQILFTTTPAADSVIIAEWLTGIETDFQMPIGVSNCALRDAISGVQMLVIQRDRQVATAGQTLFTLAPGKSYVQGANKIWVYRNGKKLDINNDYAETSTTSVTLFMPCVSGDILEFMIFKGAPPITSIALDDLTDVTTDLANSIKDTSVLRIAPATAANPLATLADVLGAKKFIHAGSAVFNPPATFTTAPLVLTDVPTIPAMVTVTIPAGASQRIVIFGTASAVETYEGGAGLGQFTAAVRTGFGPWSDAFGATHALGASGADVLLRWPQAFYTEYVQLGPATVDVKLRFASYPHIVGVSTLHAPAWLVVMVQDL